MIAGNADDPDQMLHHLPLVVKVQHPPQGGRVADFRAALLPALMPGNALCKLPLFPVQLLDSLLDVAEQNAVRLWQPFQQRGYLPLHLRKLRILLR